MIQLFLIIASALVSFTAGHILRSFLRSKSLGMQTLFDSFLINSLINHQIFVAAYTTICTLTLIVSDLPPSLAKILVFIYAFTAVYDGISLFYIPLIRYTSIFNPELLVNYDDNGILRKFQSFGVATSLFLELVSSLFVGNMNKNSYVQNLAGIYAIPTENVSSSSVSVNFVFTLAISGFIILQIKLEKKNFEHSEGLLYAIIKNYKNNIHPKKTQRPLNEENNVRIAVIQTEKDKNVTNNTIETIHKDYSLLFQRIFVILIGVMYLGFFFAEKSGESLINISVFIQIVVTDLLFISIILENPKMRKFVKQKITNILHIH